MIRTEIIGLGEGVIDGVEVVLYFPTFDEKIDGLSECYFSGVVTSKKFQHLESLIEKSDKYY